MGKVGNSGYNLNTSTVVSDGENAAISAIRYLKFCRKR
jgi:hypothetical protein